jgi:dihydropteroate synthase
MEGAKVPVSVDTYKPEVAARALDLGASMVNDVTGLRDAAMVKLLARTDVPAVVMHMKGDPRTMQEGPEYADLLGEITAYLRERLHAAEAAGVDRERLLVDPGIGFGKTVEHNLQILSRLREIRSLGRPIVVGVSRKGFIGRITGQATPAERLEGSLAGATLAAREGANVIRAHDVAPTVLALRVVDAVTKGKPSA